MAIKSAYNLQAQTLIKKMSMRQFEACYCETKEEAYEKVLSYFSPGNTITCGGSTTIKELKLKEYLEAEDKKGTYTYINRDLAKDLQSKRKVFAKAALADYYIMSSNAVTTDGELVNIDGEGNRVAALCYGPSNVIIIVSMNKVVKGLDAAIDRVRNAAAPPNAVRLGCDTVCAKTGFCGDCLKPDCICADIVVTRFSRRPGRIKVILVGETMGF